MVRDVAVHRSHILAVILWCLGGCTEVPAVVPRPIAELSKPTETTESTEVAQFTTTTPAAALICNPQQSFAFLRRESYLPLATHRTEHEAAIRYRTERYGLVEGFGSVRWAPTYARNEAARTTFFGVPVFLHRKVVPALHCVEAEIKQACVNTPYQPESLSGLRTENSYHTGEVSNHLFGIAIDIDPGKNSCCNCTSEFRNSPLCRNRSGPIWERMTMPKCWVDVFEKYGFYWLGRDKLEDTMHFEFLADPDRIVGP